MQRILVVDDEQNVLHALRRELHGTYEVEAYDNPEAALQRAASGDPFALVIADYQMPGMNGVEFLKRCGALQPDAAPLILSGQADFEALAGAVNEVHIYRFLSKPWDAAELASTLAQALAHRALLLENRRLAEQCRRERNWRRVQASEKLYQVLVVDDEPNVLSAVTRDLSVHERFDDLHAALSYTVAPDQPSTHDFRFHVHALTSPQEALERAHRVGYDVVMSDYLMPEMDGLHFLEKMRRLQPDASRILFSGQADKEVLVQAINEAAIFGYVGKPWRGYELKHVVSQAVAYRNLLRENRYLAGLMSR